MTRRSIFSYGISETNQIVTKCTEQITKARKFMTSKRPKYDQNMTLIRLNYDKKCTIYSRDILDRSKSLGKVLENKQLFSE